MLLTPGEIVALPVGVWRQVDPLPVVEERNDAEVRRAGDSTLKIIHQAQTLGGAFVLLFGEVRNPNGVLRLHQAPLQLVQRDHVALVDRVKEHFVVNGFL